MKLITVLFFAVLSATLSSCSWVTSPQDRAGRTWEEAPADQALSLGSFEDDAFTRALDKETEVSPEELGNARAAVKEEVPGIELTWEPPSQPFDGFVIHYGFDRSDLSKQLRVPTESITQVVGPQEQSLFRYVIGGVPPEKTVYIAVASFKGAEESPLSEVWEVLPAHSERL